MRRTKKLLPARNLERGRCRLSRSRTCSAPGWRWWSWWSWQGTLWCWTGWEVEPESARRGQALPPCRACCSPAKGGWSKSFWQCGHCQDGAWLGLRWHLQLQKDQVVEDGRVIRNVSFKEVHSSYFNTFQLVIIMTLDIVLYERMQPQ